MAEPYKKQQIESFNYGDEPEEPQEIVKIIDQEELITEHKNLIVLKNNMFKVNLLLLNEDELETIQELKIIKDELLPAIDEQEERIRQLQKNREFYFSVNRLNSEDIDKLVKAYFEQDKKWYNGKMLSIDTEEQFAEVQFIGYQEVLNLHAAYIKVQPVPDSNVFIAGLTCEAIYPSDGRYYQGIIEKVSDEGYHFKFKKFNSKEIISIHHLREIKKQHTVDKVKNIPESGDDFVVPDNLKWVPTDNEQQKAAKKKKLKAMKQAFKQGQIDKYSQDAQCKWKQFSVKVSQVKPDLGQKADIIYRGPDMPRYKSQFQQIANAQKEID